MTDAQDVISVIVDGKVLMREQEVLTIDKNRVRKQARAIAAKIQEYLRKKGTEKKGTLCFSVYDHGFISGILKPECALFPDSYGVCRCMRRYA